MRYIRQNSGGLNSTTLAYSYFAWLSVAPYGLDCYVGAKHYIVEYPPSPKFGRVNWGLCLLRGPSLKLPLSAEVVLESLEAV